MADENDPVIDTFVNENLNHPENRVNVALFGMLNVSQFRTWLLDRLGYPDDSLIYPPRNRKGVRPDLVIATPDGEWLAAIEVELGVNHAQVATYRDRLGIPVVETWGRLEYGGDLSLEEIADHLDGLSLHDRQGQIYADHLAAQIRVALEEFRNPGAPRAEVSAEMRNHPLVRDLVEFLGERLIFTIGSVPPGCLKADTTGEQGFSLRARSRMSASGTVSLLAVSGGRPMVLFPSAAKLRRYLPGNPAAIEDFVATIRECGVDLTAFAESDRPTVAVDTVTLHLPQLVPTLAALAAA